MPIFDYKCPNCNHTQEITVRKYDDEVNCPKCQTVMSKQPCSPPFILKGIGNIGNGSFSRAKKGPKIDKELLTLSDRDLNIELGLPPDCA